MVYAETAERRYSSGTPGIDASRWLASPQRCVRITEYSEPNIGRGHMASRQVTQLPLRFVARDGTGSADAEALEDLAESLRIELLDAGVDRIERTATGPAPAGTRGVVEDITGILELMVTASEVAGSLNKTVHVIQRWWERHRARGANVTLEIAGTVVDDRTPAELVAHVVAATTVGTPGPDVTTRGARSALVIANLHFDDAALHALRSPADDAQALHRVLSDPAIGGFDIELSLDEDESTIRRRVADFFADRDRDDLLLLHYSGHGLKDTRGRLHLAARDTTLRRLTATGVPAAFISDQITESASRRVILILDCCYSGAFARGSSVRADQSVHLQEEFGGSGRVVLTASSATEYAFEGDRLSESSATPSVFTSALVRGLETGHADLDVDGDITVDELYDYIYREVRREQPGQAPMKWSFGIEGALVVARSVRPAALPRSILDDLDSERVALRMDAVAALARLLGHEKPGLREAAAATLGTLRDGDDSARVRSAAQAALDDAVATRPRRVPEQRPDTDAEFEAARAEAARVEAARAEAARAEAERAEAERAEAERIEAERVAAEHAAAERLRAAIIETEREQSERLEVERIEAARIESERIEAERIEAESREARRRAAALERAEREQAEREQAERDQAERGDADPIEISRAEPDDVTAVRTGRARRRGILVAAGIVVIVLAAFGISQAFGKHGGTGAAGPGKPSSAPTTGLAGCVTAPDTCNSGSRRSGGTITIAIPDEPTTFNPASRNATAGTYDLANLVYPSAFIARPSGAVDWNHDLFASEPAVTSTSPFTVEYHFKPSAAWSDGTKIGADDLTYEWLTQNGHDATIPVYTTYGYDAISTITSADGGETAQVVFKHPFADWKTLFGTIPPLHALGADTTDKDTETAFTKLDAAPTISGGPYVLQSTADGEYTFEPNPHWYGATPTTLARIVAKPIADRTALASALASGQVDAADVPATAIDVQNARKDQADGLEQAQGAYIEHIGLNPTKPGLTDPVVREAILDVIDAQAIVDATVTGFYPTATRIYHHSLLPGMTGYQETVKTVAPRQGDGSATAVAAARSQLEQSGYTGAISGGVLTKNGVAVPTLRYVITDTVERKASAALVAGYLRAIGIRTTVVITPSLTTTLDKRDYDLIQVGYTALPYLGEASDLWSGTNAPFTLGTFQAASDAKLAQLAAEPDPAKQATLLNQQDAILTQAAVDLPLYARPTVFAAGSAFVGIRGNDFAGFTYNAQDWGLRQN
jgi:ABC-type transport system substrate-binding protein